MENNYCYVVTLFKTCCHIRALRVHYGVRHKVVLDHLALKLGLNKDNLKRSMREGRRQAVANRMGQQQAIGGVGSPTKLGGAQPAAALPPYKAIAEDKKFPRCRLCNYRYFTRIDLKRHLVDSHLRARLSRDVPKGMNACPSPGCGAKFDAWQACLRHYAQKHQHLDQLLYADHGLQLSDFPFSAKDAEMDKARAEAEAAGTKMEAKDIQDLAELPIRSAIDVKCNSPSCELCGEEFTTSVNKVGYKNILHIQ